jgi:hypothetical protein
VLTANSNFKKMSEQVNEQYTLQYTHNTSTFGANLFQQLSIMCTILVPFFVLYLGPLSQIFAYTQYGTFSSACTLNRIWFFYIGNRIVGEERDKPRWGFNKLSIRQRNGLFKSFLQTFFSLLYYHVVQ